MSGTSTMIKATQRLACRIGSVVTIGTAVIGMAIIGMPQGARAQAASQSSAATSRSTAVPDHRVPANAARSGALSGNTGQIGARSSGSGVIRLAGTAKPGTTKSGTAIRAAAMGSGTLRPSAGATASASARGATRVAGLAAADVVDSQHPSRVRAGSASAALKQSGAATTGPAVATKSPTKASLVGAINRSDRASAKVTVSASAALETARPASVALPPRLSIVRRSNQSDACRTLIYRHPARRWCGPHPWAKFADIAPIGWG